MGFDDMVEDPPWQELGNLNEDIFSLIHVFFDKNHIFRFKSSPYKKNLAETIYKEFSLKFNAH
ncbi:hypothetical protein SAMN04487911_10337 [Arenibacter nanhaiticus]|uniref:Uncharacterized protein n=1 Tax=Arenibacter nanhaiticus TaxID=558155 RepID=A0A1M6C070_9FLAO|nr:hypothetical protein SAMN04487911_10337 [Arenibacter nanhaiticus]